MVATAVEGVAAVKVVVVAAVEAADEIVDYDGAAGAVLAVQGISQTWDWG